MAGCLKIGVKAFMKKERKFKTFIVMKIKVNPPKNMFEMNKILET